MNYPSTQLGSVVEFLDHRRRPTTAKDRIPGPIPYYGANGLQDSVVDHLFDEPLVLLAEDGGHFGDPKRRIAYRIDGKSWVNNHAHVLRPGPSLDRDYLCRLLENYDVRPYITGTTRAKLTKAGASRIPFPLPPLDEQRRIAVILDKADDLRAKRREAIAHLDALTQSIFHNMFPTKAVMTVDLGSVLEFVTSGGRGWAKYYAEHGSQFIRSLDVQPNKITSDQPVFVDAPDNAESLRTRVQKDDVLLTITGSLIGRAAPVLTEHGGAYISQHVAILRPKSSIQPVFLSHFLNTVSAGQRLIKAAQYGQTKPGLNFEQIRRFAVPHASGESQRAFAVRVAAVERLKDHHRAQLTELNALFASLQHRAFKGEP